MTNNKEYHRQYYLTHRDRILAKRKAYYEQNPDKIRTRTKAFGKAHPLVVVWKGMMQRCGLQRGASVEQLTNYAGRGIVVCEEWRTFKTFEAWCLANGWKKGLQLDRIDNDGNYCPENCRFVTPRENQLNKRNTVLAAGIPLATWYEAYKVKMDELGLTYDAVKQRFTNLGWSLEDSLFMPVKKAKPCRQDLPDDWYEQMELSAVQYYSDQISA